MPGIRRRRAGKGFTYRGESGPIRDEATLTRIKALAIPPAWTDVWISADPRGHIQATGRDAKGRKQYRYHPDFRAHRDAAKFERLYEFGTALPAIRRQVAHDLALPGVPKEKVIATIVRLLELTLVRVGNEEYAKTNKSYGLTTLRDQHAKFTSDGLKLVFKAKHGIAANVRVQDRKLARIVKRCQDLPGQVLFQYVDDDGSVRPISSTDVNDYLREITGTDITAKDFRTWIGTLLAASALAELRPPRRESEAKRNVVQVCKVVSDHLGNTPTVCRASYMHPNVVDSYRDGSLATAWEQPARGSRALVPEERKLLAFLKPRRTRRQAA
jgi:DNA topoisomerase-1